MVGPIRMPVVVIPTIVIAVVIVSIIVVAIVFAIVVTRRIVVVFIITLLPTVASIASITSARRMETATTTKRATIKTSITVTSATMWGVMSSATYTGGCPFFVIWVVWVPCGLTGGSEVSRGVCRRRTFGGDRWVRRLVSAKGGMEIA